MASARVIKAFYLIYLVLLGIFSAGVTILSAIILVQTIRYADFLNPLLVMGPNIALLCIAVLVLPMIMILGFKAYSTSKLTLSIVYWVLILITGIGIFVIAVWSIILNFNLYDNLAADLKEFSPTTFTQYDKQQWDTLQNNLECCGVNGVSDYMIKGGHIPLSCCNQIEYSCAKLHSQGCLSQLNEFGSEKLIQITIIAAVLATYLLIGIIPGITFSRLLGRTERTNDIPLNGNFGKPDTMETLPLQNGKAV